jgi:hypothetical protein
MERTSDNFVQARDGLMWFGGLWTTIVTTVTVAKAAGKPVPALAAIPIFMGGFMLTNMCVTLPLSRLKGGQARSTTALLVGTTLPTEGRCSGADSTYFYLAGGINHGRARIGQYGESQMGAGENMVVTLDTRACFLCPCSHSG